MTEQTRNITEAVLAKNLDDRRSQLKKDRALSFLNRIEKHLKRLRTLHHFGSTQEEVKANMEDSYFSTWFAEAESGDIQAMHSILDHFEPLEVITNMGHNYRCKFSMDTTDVLLDFRPGDKIPAYDYELKGTKLEKQATDKSLYDSRVKSYLYSSILRMAKELSLYFPLKKFSFIVNCETLNMSQQVLSLSEADMEPFAKEDLGENFNDAFEKVAKIQVK